MQQQYHSLPDAMYVDYRQPPPSYQENYHLMYPHSNFQHYRSSMPSSGGNDFGYDYSQQYYPPLQSSNSYGMLPGYNNESSAFTSNFHASPYSSNFYPPTFSSLENHSKSSSSALNLKTDVEPESEQNELLESSATKNSPTAHSDRSESSFSSKLEICSKGDDTLTDLAENIGDSEQNPVDTVYQSCNEENVSSKKF